MCVMCSPEWSNAWGKKLYPDLPPKQLIKDTDEFKNIVTNLQDDKCARLWQLS